eukprot:c20059_g1_i1 orf=131-508(+)
MYAYYEESENIPISNEMKYAYFIHNSRPFSRSYSRETSSFSPAHTQTQQLPQQNQASTHHGPASRSREAYADPWPGFLARKRGEDLPGILPRCLQSGRLVCSSQTLFCGSGICRNTLQTQARKWR